jgi:hypothetical protein
MGKTWRRRLAMAKHGDKVGYTPIYGPSDGGGDGYGAGNQWGWPDDECMDIMPGLGKQGG